MLGGWSWWTSTLTGNLLSMHTVCLHASSSAQQQSALLNGCRCGPCKLMLPLLEQMAVDLEGKVDIVKFNCNKKNKELGQSLGIKVAPTFHIYRDTVQVGTLPNVAYMA